MTTSRPTQDEVQAQHLRDEIDAPKIEYVDQKSGKTKTLNNSQWYTWRVVAWEYHRLYGVGVITCGADRLHAPFGRGVSKWSIRDLERAGLVSIYREMTYGVDFTITTFGLRVMPTVAQLQALEPEPPNDVAF